MELLIPGLILVALMVYASTRIKKTAALAFEPETIETDEFVIKKPEGFLNVIGGDPQYAFEAYSKDFGAAPAEDVRQATVTIKVADAATVDEAVANLTLAGDVIVSDAGEVVSGLRYRLVETTETEKGITLRCFHKIAEKNGKLYQLEIKALAETGPQFMRTIQAMLASFELR